MIRLDLAAEPILDNCLRKQALIREIAAFTSNSKGIYSDFPALLLLDIPSNINIGSSNNEHSLTQDIVDSHWGHIPLGSSCFNILSHI